MNKYKYLITLIPALLGIVAAYAMSKRVTFTYTNQMNNGIYTKTASYSPAKCVTNSTRKCAYVSPVDLGALTTATDLEANGAIGTVATKIYIP